MNIINMVSHYVPIDPASEPFLSLIALFVKQIIESSGTSTSSDWIFLYVSLTFGPVIGPVYLFFLHYIFS